MSAPALRFAFCGNRFHVLGRMLEHGLPVVAIYAVTGSYLERELASRGIAHQTLVDRAHLVTALEAGEFDLLIACGCPHILPASRLAAAGKRLVNIHPSYLPDLRGIDPVPGAILFGRKSGASCHLMDDGIDTGPLIARVAIANSPCLDAGLLYQLSFRAEVEVFDVALAREFEPDPGLSPECADPIYYSRRPGDLEIDFRADAASIIRRIRANDSLSQGAFFVWRGEKVVVHDAELVLNQFLMERRDRWGENEVVLIYERKIVLRKGDGFLKLKAISGRAEVVAPGDVLTGGGHE